MGRNETRKDRSTIEKGPPLEEIDFDKKTLILELRLELVDA